jgi:hypothetical protein
MNKGWNRGARKYVAQDARHLVAKGLNTYTDESIILAKIFRMRVCSICQYLPLWRRPVRSRQRGLWSIISDNLCGNRRSAIVQSRWRHGPFLPPMARAFSPYSESLTTLYLERCPRLVWSRPLALPLRQYHSCRIQLSAAQPQPNDLGEVEAFLPSRAICRAALSGNCRSARRGGVPSLERTHLSRRDPLVAAAPR